MKNNRISGLDHLRGIMAVLIMVYHYSSWLFGYFDSSTFLGRIGVYGVSIFYILSGLTLYWVYSEKLYVKNIKKYFLRRFLRIYPLLILVTLLTVFLLRDWGVYFSKARPIVTLLLNISGAFGFYAPERYISTGAWSIGNELVFYALFPFLIFMNKWNTRSLYVFYMISVLIGAYFAFITIDGSNSLSSNWKPYINPFNQLFLFISGIIVVKLFERVPKNNVIFGLVFFLSLLAFIMYPVHGDRVNLVAGLNRFVFSIFSIGLVLSVYKLGYTFPKPIQFFLDKCGDMCYSIYLIHPVVFYTLNKYDFVKNVDAGFNFAICVVLTFGISLIVNTLVEKPFINAFRK